ncbi:TEX14 kinase, partial [Corythaeola cristata]|nr:TEX14 kinase [Corythaeola cristata]
NVDSPLGRFLKGGANAAKNIYSFGFGKFYLAGSGHLGYLASLPIIGEKDLVQADDEPTFSYHVGPYMIMTNLMWEGSRVTVKELSFEPHQNCSKLRLADLLIAEQEHSSKLCHPRLLQLMSVCLSNDLEKTRLVYERVNFGSLYSILHERRTEFPVLRMETILYVLLQISDALRFLHSRGFIHRSVTSYAIQIVSSGEAKLCNLEYMIESKDCGGHSDLTRIPVPVQLYKWCSPEVILEKVVTVKSDIYSFCTVMQEALTGISIGLGFSQRPAVFADVNICLASAFSYQKRTQELQGKEITEADSAAAPRYSLFPEENSALVDHEASTSLQPVAWDKNHDVASELQATLSVSDVDDSLHSFEINEIFASYPELQEDFPEEGAGLGQTLKGEKWQQKEDKAALGDLFAFPGMQCEEKPVHEEGGFSESSIEYTTEEEERVSEEEVRGDSRKRMSYLSQNEEQLISKCVHDLKIAQSMLQQAADSLCRTEKKLDDIEAAEKQKKLLREITMSQLSKQSFQEGHGNRSDDNSQNTNNSFSGVNTFLWRAIGPPSRNYVPRLITCQAQGTLGGDSFQAVSKTAKEMEAIQNEKRKCFRDMSKSENENNHHDLSFSNARHVLNHGLLDSFQHLLPRVSVRCKKKFDSQCQRGGDSHSAASGSEKERCCYPKSRSEIYSTEINEERRMTQSEWWTEVQQMARRVASGQLELSCAYPAAESTSESEAESIEQAFPHVTVRVKKSQDQQRHKWQTVVNVEPLDLGSEDTSEFEESNVESAFRSSGGKADNQKAISYCLVSLHLPADFTFCDFVTIIGHSRELHCSPNSSCDASEEFSTADPDDFLPTATEGSAELEVKITEKTGMKSASRTLDVSYTTRGFLMLPFDLKKSCRKWENDKFLFFSFEIISTNNDLSKSKKILTLSVTDIQDLSSIPYEQESYYRDIDCKTPRVSHAPTSVSTPLSSDENNPAAFKKYKHCHASDSSFCGSQELSSAVSRTFTTAYEEGENTEIPAVASGVCSSELNEPV